MNIKHAIHTTVVIILMHTSLLGAGAPLGFPASVLETGQWTLGADLAIGETDLEAG